MGSNSPNSPSPLRDILPKGKELGISLRITKGLLKKISEIGLQNGAKTIVTYLPYTIDFDNSNEYKKKVDSICQDIEDFSVTNGFRFLDIRSKLLEGPNTDIFVDKVHLNADGHKLVSEILGKFLISEGFLKYPKIFLNP